VQPHLCGLEKLRLYGSAVQQARYFAVALRGDLITNASAERGGKVVGDIASRVRRHGAGYRLTGRKYYSTGSLFAEYLYVTTKTEDGVRAIALVPSDRPGIEILEDWDGFGQRTTASGTTVLDDVELAPDELMLLPDFGKRRTHEGGVAQILHAAIDAGIALAALADAVGYARTARPVPESGVGRASDDPYVLHTVGEMAVLAHGAVAMVERGAEFLDRATEALFAGRPADALLAEASIAVGEAKVAAENASLRVGELIFRTGGASATSRALNLDRHWRNARTHTTHDPAAYKAKMIGDYFLNDRPPPVTTKY
jgi:alkylation response protein AidB-like acyl-CoA dehydrogenase